MFEENNALSGEMVGIRTIFSEEINWDRQLLEKLKDSY